MNECEMRGKFDAPLAARLRDRIRRAGGALSFHDWMQAALYDEREGYYCRADRTRWGGSGDYRTSAEQSVLFGAAFARYFAEIYEEFGAPDRFTIIEAGAGAGDFAQNVLRTLYDNFPHVFRKTLYVIDETSEDARVRAR
jgi:SAM-dependent MidA family methyltransferase